MRFEKISKVFYNVLPSRIIESLKPLFGVPSIELSLLNLKKNGVEISRFIDIGAYKGGFSLMMEELWPNSIGFMIEANPAYESYLKEIVSSNQNLSHKICLLGSKEMKDVPFYLSETASSVLKNHIENGKFILLETRKLDSLLIEKKILKVDLLKLDVQGFELEVLKGGTEILSNSKIVLLEVALLDIYKDTPLVIDVINFMDRFEFVLYDICSVDIKRPLDNALWQSDFLFVKKDSILRSKKSYF